MVLFLVIATALGTVITSSISSHRLSREKTIADEVALQELESIRRLPYESVGVVSGNPPGTVVASKTVSVRGLNATITTQISYVNDPTPTSYATSANYKRVVVTVTRARDGKQLTSQSTYVAPPARAPYGGINFAIVNAQVVDVGDSTPVSGVTVQLGTGPSAPRSDSTGQTGLVTFAALTANPESGPDAYYDLTLDLPAGYVVLAEDTPPGAAAHAQLAPGQTFDTALRVYRPATIEIELRASDGSAYGGVATVTVSSSRGSEAFEYTGGPLTVTTIGGEQVVPGLEYTVSAVGAGGVEAPPATQYVPDDYPTDLSSSFTLTFPPVGVLAVSVTWAGAPASGATVTVTGGPDDVSLSGTTDATGAVTFANVTAGTGYTVTATKGGASASATADVVEGETTAVALALPTGGVAVSVTWAGSPVAGATVTLSGGPEGISASGTTDGTGSVSFANAPAGAGYTVTASKSGQSASASASVGDGQTTSVSLALPTGTVIATVTWAGLAVSGATVTLTGGPMGTSVSGTTGASGVLTFANVPAGTGYTVAATRSGQSASASTSVAAYGTSNVSLALPTGSLTVRVRRGSSNQSGATVKVTGGPMGITLTGTTVSGGLVTFTDVPVGSPYTVKAWKCSVSNPKSATNSAVTVNAGSNSLTITFSTNTCPLP